MAIDFNGDDTDDILIRRYDGQVHTWLLDNAQIVHRIDIENTSWDWNIEQVGDFNEDGITDILNRRYDGQVHAWLLDNAQIVHRIDLEHTSFDWNIEQVGDFNGDGTTDIMNRRYDGQVHTWLLKDGDTGINCEGNHGESYYLELSGWDDNKWDWAAGDNTRITGKYWDVENDETNYVNHEQFLQVYNDLSEALVGEAYNSSAGYVQDPSYFNAPNAGGKYGYHSGIDIDTLNWTPTPVKALVGGTASIVQNISGNYFLEVAGDDDRYYRYGHLSSLDITSGRVDAGDKIGEVGMSEASNHLHFQVNETQSKPFGYDAWNQSDVYVWTMNPIKIFWELENANGNHEDCDNGSGGTSSSLIANENISPGTVLETMNITWGSKNLTVGAFDSGKNMNAVLAAIRAHESNGRYGSFGGSTPGDHGADTSIGAYQESYASTYLPEGNSVMGTSYSLTQFNSGNPFAQDITAIGRIKGHGLFDLINNANLNDSQQRFNIAEGVVNAWGSWFSDRDQINSTPQQKYDYRLSHSQAIFEALEWA